MLVGISPLLTDFVSSAGGFYVGRFFLGLDEASFFPGMIVFLTHWFRERELSGRVALA